MSLNIKIEPFDSSIIVDVSSDDDDLPKIEIPINKRPERSGTPDTHCSICLEELTNKCYSDTCWHMFCFECLRRWSTIESSCPLCKKTFKIIYHTFTDQGLHETYIVPSQEQVITPRIFLRPFGELSDVNRLFRMNFFLDLVRRNERLLNNFSNLPSLDYNHNTSQAISLNSSRSYEVVNNNVSVFVPETRVRIYIDNMWAEPLPDLSGRFRDCTSAFYRENPAQTHRLQRFVTRDITAIRSIRTSAELDTIDLLTPEGIITNLILQSILTIDIRDSSMTTLLIPYLGTHTPHFCHELYNFANSPYDLIGYDRNVRYFARDSYSPIYQTDLNAIGVLEPTPVPLALSLPLNTVTPNETIVLDSDDDEIIVSRHFGPETIVLSSSSDNDSEVEIIHSGFVTHTIEDSDSSRDQPSTSTGIRDSLDQPNNRYNLRRRRFTPPLSSLPGYRENNIPRISTHTSSLRREERIVLDSSSEDEESRSRTRNSQPVHSKTEVVCGRRKRKIKKNHVRKKKRNIDESRPVTHISSRSRSYSGSSSSSGDTDTTRSNNNNRVSIHTDAA